MWRILLGLWFLLGAVPSSVGAQQWTGTAALGVTGGHQTNTYLDPVLSSWDRTTDPAFAALTPQVGLVRNAHRTRLDLTARARLYPRRSNTPQFVQGNARLRYRLSPAWAVGTMGGGTRYRFASSRDSWWALPSIRWTPTQNSTLTLRGGITERYIDTDQGTTDRQLSGIVALTASTWLTDRLHAGGRLYWSSGQTSLVDTEYGGTGLSVRGTYWPTSTWSVEAEVAAEQLHYQTVQASSPDPGPPGGPGPPRRTTTETVRDRIGRGGLETRWRPSPSVTLFARAQALAARLAQTDQLDTDVHVSAGLRIQVQRVLGGTAEPPPRRRVCEPVDQGVRVRVPYDGNGTPHLTGDFNDWTLPGIPLTQTDEDVWTTTLPLSAGQYAYRVRIVDGTESRWLDLPSYAQTANDAFGGTNGVCTVH